MKGPSLLDPSRLGPPPEQLSIADDIIRSDLSTNTRINYGVGIQNQAEDDVVTIQLDRESGLNNNFCEENIS